MPSWRRNSQNTRTESCCSVSRRWESFGFSFSFILLSKLEVRFLVVSVCCSVRGERNLVSDVEKYAGTVFYERLVLVEHVAQWLRHWTQDLGVWGSIPAALLMCKSLGQALNPHRLCPPCSNMYQVERKIGSVWMASAAENVLHFRQGDKTVKVWVPTPRGKRSKRWAFGDIWNVNTHLFYLSRRAWGLSIIILYHTVDLLCTWYAECFA